MTNIIDFSSYKKKKDLKTNQDKIRLHDNQVVLNDLQMNNGFFGGPPAKEVDLSARMDAVKTSLGRLNELMEQLKGKK